MFVVLFEVNVFCKVSVRLPGTLNFSYSELSESAENDAHKHCVIGGLLNPVSIFSCGNRKFLSDLDCGKIQESFALKSELGTLSGTRNRVFLAFV